MEGLERYPVNVRFPRELRNDLATLRAVAVPTPMGHTVPLAQVADIGIVKGPPAIKSENARRTAWIYVDLKTTDIGGYVQRARRRGRAGGDTSRRASPSSGRGSTSTWSGPTSGWWSWSR